MRWLMGIVGLLLGLSAGLAAMAYNPLGFWGAPVQLADTSRTLVATAAVSRGPDWMPRSLLGSDGRDEEALPDLALRHVAAEIALLQDGSDGARVLAVKLSSLARGNQIERADVQVEAAWNLFWPGRGSLFVAGPEQHWQRLVDAAAGAVSGRGFVPAEQPYLVAGAQRGGGQATVLGATGEFDGLRGAHEFWLTPAGDRLELGFDAD